MKGKSSLIIIGSIFSLSAGFGAVIAWRIGKALSDSDIRLLVGGCVVLLLVREFVVVLIELDVHVDDGAGVGVVVHGGHGDFRCAVVPLVRGFAKYHQIDVFFIEMEIGLVDCGRLGLIEVKIGALNSKPLIEELSS